MNPKYVISLVLVVIFVSGCSGLVVKHDLEKLYEKLEGQAKVLIKKKVAEGLTGVEEKLLKENEKSRKDLENSGNMTWEEFLIAMGIFLGTGGGLKGIAWWRRRQNGKKNGS